MRGEGDSTGDEGGAPTPFRRGPAGCRVGKYSRSGRTNEGVDGVPNSVKIRNLVGEEFQEIERDGDSENPWMSQSLQSRRETEHAETLKQAERRDGGVEIQTGRKSGSQREAERFDRIHLALS